MLHLLYILAFTLIAVLAITNLVRSLISFSTDTQRFYPNDRRATSAGNRSKSRGTIVAQNIHPELLDEQGRVINEPLLVMKSVSVDDARQQLDALYDSSPNKTQDNQDS